MIILNLQNLSVYFGERELFSNLELQLAHNEKAGLVGANGTGKTTLFKVIKGELEPESGTLAKASNASLGYMEQHVIRDMTISLYHETLSIFEPLIKLEKELEEINRQIDAGDHSEEIIEKQSKLQAKFYDDGGLTYKSRTASTLIGLGFSEKDFTLPVEVLSGGQKSKLQLAKLLLSSSQILLLDEPTNHLDINSVEWLEKFLLEYKGAAIVISHDRYFLDKVTTKTFELENKRLKSYNGNYSAYLVLKQQYLEQVEKKYAEDKKEIIRMQEMITRFRSFNREKSIKQAESKQKQLDKFLLTVEKPPERPPVLNFKFAMKQDSGNDVLLTKDLSLSFGEKQLFDNVELDIRKGEHVFLLGPNGCGKTSLFRLLTGEYPSPDDSIRFGSRVDLGYFDQVQSGLNMENIVIDEIWDTYPQMTETKVRNALATFLFRDDDVFKRISALSGGERARIALLKIMLSGANFLLLDEPTNHLDIASREALENALLSYEGTLLIISHDRYLINKLADKIYYLADKTATLYKGDYDDFLQTQLAQLAEHGTNSPSQVQEKKAEKKPNDYKLRKEKASEIKRLNTLVNRLETQYSDLEAIIEEDTALLSTPEIATDYEKTSDIYQRLEENRIALDEILVQWEDALLRLEEMSEEE